MNDCTKANSLNRRIDLALAFGFRSQAVTWTRLLAVHRASCVECCRG